MESTPVPKKPRTTNARTSPPRTTAAPDLSVILDDLSSRFIINLPDEEFASVERMCFQLELAHWFYEDFYASKNNTLPSFSMKEFCNLMFDHCELLHPYKYNVDEVLQMFKEYKGQVPVYGAIILNAELDKCLLVKGFSNKSSWGFPKGKINQNEPEIDCAVREVYEETSFDLTGFLHEEDHLEIALHKQKIKLYIARGVPEDSYFEPRTRKEISRIEWFLIDDLPLSPAEARDRAAFIGAGRSEQNFFMVTPFVKKLKKWIKTTKKNQRNGYSNNNSLLPNVAPSDELNPQVKAMFNSQASTPKKGSIKRTGNTPLKPSANSSPNLAAPSASLPQFNLLPPGFAPSNPYLPGYTPYLPTSSPLVSAPTPAGVPASTAGANLMTQFNLAAIPNAHQSATIDPNALFNGTAAPSRATAAAPMAAPPALGFPPFAPAPGMPMPPGFAMPPMFPNNPMLHFAFDRPAIFTAMQNVKAH